MWSNAMAQKKVRVTAYFRQFIGASLAVDVNRTVC